MRTRNAAGQAYALRLLGDNPARHRRHRDRAPRRATTTSGPRPDRGSDIHQLQAHSHLGLGNLCLKSGQHDEAHAELSAAIELYRAMEMTFWLPRAEKALAEVVGR